MVVCVKLLELVTLRRKNDEMGYDMNQFNWRLDSTSFNIDNGYLEGIVRGFKSGILMQADYLNLTQCDTLEGMYYIYIGLFMFKNYRFQQTCRP